MNILLLEPYFTGSHKAWALGYQKYSRHHVEILSLSGNFWKWRMHGGAISLAKEFLSGDMQPDVLVASDMLDVTTFLALTRHKTARLPTAVYFHENQLTYPWSPTDRDIVQNRDHHYGFINYVTALAADVVLFNSQYHRDSFNTELKRFLMHFPDNRAVENVEIIAEKSFVLPLGLDLSRFDEHKPEQRYSEEPLILWNHRWEFDKNPEEFYKALFVLAERGLEFQVAVLGECFSQQPRAFTVAKDILGNRIVQFGFAENWQDYAAWLWHADILPVTSHQDFFGASIVEAIYCGCLPLLPKRLAYPDLIPQKFHEGVFYEDFDDLVIRLETAIGNGGREQCMNLRETIRKYDWKEIVCQYDDLVENLYRTTHLDN